MTPEQIAHDKFYVSEWKHCALSMADRNNAVMLETYIAEVERLRGLVEAAFREGMLASCRSYDSLTLEIAWHASKTKADMESR